MQIFCCFIILTDHLMFQDNLHFHLCILPACVSYISLRPWKLHHGMYTNFEFTRYSFLCLILHHGMYTNFEFTRYSFLCLILHHGGPCTAVNCLLRPVFEDGPESCISTTDFSQWMTCKLYSLTTLPCLNVHFSTIFFFF